MLPDPDPAAPDAESGAVAEPAPQGATAPAPKHAADASPEAVVRALRELFPALFTGAPKPIKLRIQADIQERAPGRFTKAMLSTFLRRHTGGTGYLIALTKATQRFDLDGQPAGELSEEHRKAAAEELARRRAIRDEREAQGEEARRSRAGLLHAFETTTLTPANFCALKGIAPEALDAVLEQARREREERARQAPPRDDRRPPFRDDRRPPFRDDRRPPRSDERRPPRSGEGRPPHPNPHPNPHPHPKGPRPPKQPSRG